MSENTGEVASLGVARAKLANVIEIYAPMTGRAAVLEAWGQALIEYEAAVREDERAVTGADIAIFEAQTKAFDASAAAAKANGFEPPVAPTAAEMSPPPPPPISTDMQPKFDSEGTDANGSPVAPTAPPPPVAPTAPVVESGRRSRK